jgi:hypothetical protein
MIDSPEKFRRIVRECQSSGMLFTDERFKGDNSSCGPISGTQVKEWRRPGPECVLYEGGVSPEDIK